MSRLKRNKGFTLAEVLMVVAILAILFGLATPAVISAQKSLRQKELDTKAETIYMAVQNRLTELYTSGQTELYNPSSYFNLKEYSNKPSDYLGDYLDGNKNCVYYFLSGSDVSENILGDVTISEDLKSGYFIIEIVPYAVKDKNDTSNSYTLTSPSVYSVYYSEGDYDVRNDAGKITSLEQYRDSSYRTSMSKAQVGYYGGGYIGGTSASESITISSIVITSNEDINKGLVKINVPLDSTVTYFEFTLTDYKGNEALIKYDTSSKRFSLGDTNVTDKGYYSFEYDSSTGTYSFDLAIDDLSDSSTRFGSLYSKLTAGSDISLSVKAYSSKGSIKEATGIAYGNSLFAYTGEETLELSDTANITNARHLQNLDDGSKVNSAVTKAVLNSDIKFSEFNETYNATKGYYNKRKSITSINSNGNTYSETVVNFEPIHNTNLTSLSSNNGTDNYIIYNLSILNSDGDAGLFGKINNSQNLAISNISLVGATVVGKNHAGGFVGYIESNKSNVTLTRCFVYLSSDNNDIPANVPSTKSLENIKWITSNSDTGGLVGRNLGKLTITDCLSSTVLGNDSTGGLVGYNSGTLTISNSYSSGYLFGNRVGGLVGENNDSTVKITNCFAGGYIGLNSSWYNTGAGLVNGYASSISNSYTVVDCYNVDDNGNLSTSGDFTGSYYSTVRTIGSSKNLYYKKANVNTWYTIGKTIKNMNLNSGFTKVAEDKTHYYNLMAQYLEGAYEYYVPSGLKYYGDYVSDSTAASNVLGIAGVKSDGSYTYSEVDLDNLTYNWRQYSSETTYSKNLTTSYTYYVYERGTDILSNNQWYHVQLYTKDQVNYLNNQNNDDAGWINRDYTNWNTYNNDSYKVEVGALSEYDSKGYRFLPITITIKSNDLTSRDDLCLVLYIQGKDNMTYKVGAKNISVKPIAYTLTLDANAEYNSGAKFSDGSQIKTYDLKNGTTYDLNNLDIPVKDGYAFREWYYVNTKLNTTKVSTDTEPYKNQDVVLSAQYEKKYNVIFKAKYDDNTEIQLGSTYYLNSNKSNSLDVSIDLSKIPDGYKLEGWYYGDIKVLDSDGNLVCQSLDDYVNGYVFVTYKETTPDLVLYAKFTHATLGDAFTSASSIETGKYYIITSGNDGEVSILNVNDVKFGFYKVTISDNSISRSFVNNACIWKAVADGTNINLSSAFKTNAYLQIEESGNLKTSAKILNHSWEYNNSTNYLTYNGRYLSYYDGGFNGAYGTYGTQTKVYVYVCTSTEETVDKLPSNS